MAEHAIFSPSSFSRLLSCPASFRESQSAPKGKASSYAIHGTLLHDVFTRVWPHYVSGMDGEIELVFVDAKVEPEDQQYVLSCCDYVKSQLITCGPNATIELEKKVSLASWGLPDVWGTADVVIDDPDNQRMLVSDHKFGQGVPVYAQDNPQLLTYLAGAVDFPPKYDEYTATIIQPPLDIYSAYTISRQQLIDFVSKVALGIESCKKPDAPYAPSESACRFCPARSTCRARHDMAVNEAKEVFTIAKKMPDVTNAEKGRLAMLLSKLEQVKKTLYADLQATIMDGGSVPGWKLVAGRSIRKWADEGSAMKYLMKSKSIHEDNMFEQKFISPSKAEKLNRKLKKSDDFQNLIIKPVGKPQLVQETDKRPDYDVNATAEGVFAKLK